MSTHVRVPSVATGRLVVLALLLLAVAPLGAQPQPGRPVSLNFENARVTDVVRSVAAMLGLNVVFTDVPDKRISFNTTAPVRPEELPGVLESILESNNLVLVQKGAVAQVVPADKAPATGQVRVGLGDLRPAATRPHHTARPAPVHSR